MENKNNLKGMLGLASKAGTLVFGTDLVADAVRSGKCGAVFTANDASRGTLKRILNFCSECDINVFETGLSKSELAHCVGKTKDISVVATRNSNFEAAVSNLCEQLNDDFFTDDSNANTGGITHK